MNDFAELVRNLGMPVATLAALGFAMWQGLRWLAAKVVEPITAAHLHFLEGLMRTQERQTDLLQQLAQTAQRTAELVQSNAAMLTHLVERRADPPGPR